jgi:hypothetical protein
MKVILPLLLLSLLRLCASAQDSARSLVARDSARAQGLRMMKAYTRGDFDAYCRYAYPKELAKMDLPGFKAACREEGVYYKKHGTPQFDVQAGDTVYLVQTDTLLECLCPMLLQQKGCKAVYTRNIGFSKDGGQHWLFLGATNENRYSLMMDFPEIDVHLFPVTHS